MLPKIDAPLYEVTLPLAKKTYRFRPFLVKEEKLLLMASESGDEETIISTIKQIVNNCCIDEIDIETLAIIDLQFFFLHLRARSVGEISELQYKCNNLISDEQGNSKTCGHLVTMSLNVLDVKPTIPQGHSNKIEFTDKLGVVMRYPNFKNLSGTDRDSMIERLIKMIVSSIDYIYDEQNIYYAKDASTEELTEFVDSLPREHFQKIQNFFETMPKIKHDLDFNCPKCHYHETITIEGIENFFA